MIPRRLQQLAQNLRSGTNEQRLETIAELARSRQPYALDLLYETANSDQVALRTAAQAGFAQHAAANPRLALRHASLLIRHEAAYVLGQNKAKSAIEELSRCVRNDAEEVMRLVCVQALGAIKDIECIPGLRAALQDRALKVRQGAFEALRSIGGTAVENAVSDLLDDHDWPLRQAAYQLLQSTGWFPSTRRQKALWGISQGRFDDVVSQRRDAVDPLLTSTLRVNDVSVRQWSAMALARLDSEDIRRKLRGALTHPNPEVRAAAADALKPFGESAEYWLKQASAADARKQVRRLPRNVAFRAATRIMALLGHP